MLDKIFAGRKPPQDDLQQRSRDAPAAVDADGTEIYEEDLVSHIMQELERRRNERAVLELLRDEPKPEEAEKKPEAVKTQRRSAKNE